MNHLSGIERVRRRVFFGSLLALCATAAWLAFPGFPVRSGPTANAKTVAEGKTLFEHEWTPGDELATGDGLGPVYNARSCAQCHFQGGLGGAGSLKHTVTSFTVHPTPRDPNVREGVVHAFATADEFRETRETVSRLYPITPGGVRVINGCQIDVKDFDPVRFERIDSPALYGAGWIDLISPRRIASARTARNLSAMKKELQLDFSGSDAGRVRRLPDGRIGKFGWKAQFATIEEFVANACANELGLGTPALGQATPLGREATAATTDLTDEQFEAMVAFVKTLPRPTQILPDDPADRAEAMHGEEVFASVGCASCHTPDVGGVEGVYSDFMLHKLVDDIEGSYGPRSTPDVPWPTDHPTPDEWKTPPLWGVADSAPYFHDGGSPGLKSAILRHRGVATKATERYKGLQPEDRTALVAFLKTLRAPQSAPAPTVTPTESPQEYLPSAEGIQLTSR